MPISETNKAKLKKVKSDHDLHILLIMKQEDVSKGQALPLAYAEGPAALPHRLSPQK